ncbi:hypothetical protein D3C73_740190 [compost metagenome]
MNKPVALMSASPLSTGGAKAHSSLLITLKMIADVVEQKTMIIANVNKKINAEGEITDPATARDLRLLLDGLSAKILYK